MARKRTRQELVVLAKANLKKINEFKKQIAALEKKNLGLLRESWLLSDKKQWFIEKEETRGRGKKKRTELVGRVHWIQLFEDGDTGQKFKIERSREVRVNGVWVD